MKQLRFTPPLSGVVGKVGGSEKPHDVSGDTAELFYKEDIINFVGEKLKKCKEERTIFERQWTLNSNFLLGNQFCDINLSSGDIEKIEPVHDWLEREVYNQIAPIIETRIANLKKINYRMKVNPQTDDADDFKKAELAGKILKYLQAKSDFETKKNTLIAWNEICGNCFVLSWWNKDAGDVYAITAETDESGGEHLIRHTTGDVDYGILTPFEVYPESVYKQTIAAQRYIILEQVKTVDDIFDLYNLKVEGRNVDSFCLSPIASGGGYGYENTTMSLSHRTFSGAARVVTYMERPTKHAPGGRMIIIVNDEHIVYSGELPYDDIPLVQCVCREVPGQFFGRSVIEDLIPRQRAYNGCVNRIHEYIKRIALQGYIVERGAIDMDEFLENGVAPGEALEYEPGHAPPVPMPNGALPSVILEERYQLVRDMEYVAGVSQLTTSGTAPKGVTSGIALESIKATDDTRLSLTGDYVRNCVKGLAKIWLMMYKRHATARRILKISGRDALADTLIWDGSDITSYDVEYQTENELLYTDEMQKQRFLELYNLGMFTDETGRIPEQVKHIAIEAAKIGNYEKILSVNSLQIQYAERENAFFERGSIPTLSELDDDAIHYEEHLKYALGMNFSILKLKKPELAEAFSRHIMEHKSRIKTV